MLCPKCYGKVDKKQKTCTYCGFNLSALEGASNRQAKKALKTEYRDNVLYIGGIPEDVSKKKLILLSIFFGLFGVHDFYVGNFWRGLYKAITMSLTIILSTIVLSFGIVQVNNAFYIAYQFILVFQGLNILIWIFDIIRIFLERYKIPIYKDEFSKTNNVDYLKKTDKQVSDNKYEKDGNRQ